MMDNTKFKIGDKVCFLFRYEFSQCEYCDEEGHIYSKKHSNSFIRCPICHGSGYEPNSWHLSSELIIHFIKIEDWQRSGGDVHRRITYEGEIEEINIFLLSDRKNAQLELERRNRSERGTLHPSFCRLDEEKYLEIIGKPRVRWRKRIIRGLINWLEAWA